MQTVFIHRQIADGRAYGRAPGDGPDTRLDGRKVHGAESAFGRVLEVDDVGARGKYGLRFFCVAHAGEETRHAKAGSIRTGISGTAS